MTRIACPYCIYFDGQNENEEDTIGICRVRSPEIRYVDAGDGIKLPMAQWPIVSWNDWCGEIEIDQKLIGAEQEAAE